MGIKVSGCYIYPLKSGSGISVDKLELTQRGPKNDRLWMLVQNQGPNAGKFITQRDKGCEKLALVKAFPNGVGDTKFSTRKTRFVECGEQQSWAIRAESTKVKHQAGYPRRAWNQPRVWLTRLMRVESEVMTFST